MYEVFYAEANRVIYNLQIQDITCPSFLVLLLGFNEINDEDNAV